MTIRSIKIERREKRLNPEDDTGNRVSATIEKQMIESIRETSRRLREAPRLAALSKVVHEEMDKLLLAWKGVKLIGSHQDEVLRLQMSLQQEDRRVERYTREIREGKDIKEWSVEEIERGEAGE